MGLSKPKLAMGIQAGAGRAILAKASATLLRAPILRAAASRPTTEDRGRRTAGGSADVTASAAAALRASARALCASKMRWAKRMLRLSSKHTVLSSKRPSW